MSEISQQKLRSMDKWTYVAYVQYPCDQVIKNKIVIKILEANPPSYG
jgi:hypothetical protein